MFVKCAVPHTLRRDTMEIRNSPQPSQMVTTAVDLPEFPMERSPGCPFDPAPGLTRLQEHNPISRVRLWDGSTPWVVTRHADQRDLLRDPRVSADSTLPGYPSKSPGSRAQRTSEEGQIMIAMDDPEHARFRRMITAPFAIKQAETMRPTIQRIVDELIDAMLAGPKPVDLVETFALPMAGMGICELL